MQSFLNILLKKGLGATLPPTDRGGPAARGPVDGQVASLQVLLQRDVRREFGDEATVPRPRLALATGERVLGLRLRMQEYRKITAHGAIAVRQKLLGASRPPPRSPFLHLATQQRIADRAAHQIDLHVLMVLKNTVRMAAVIAGLLLLSGCYLMQAATANWQ